MRVPREEYSLRPVVAGTCWSDLGQLGAFAYTSESKRGASQSPSTLPIFTLRKPVRVPIELNLAGRQFLEDASPLRIAACLLIP